MAYVEREIVFHLLIRLPSNVFFCALKEGEKIALGTANSSLKAWEQCEKAAVIDSCPFFKSSVP